MLNDSQLQGASLEYAQLQGTSLNKAQLQGASLDEAQIQGAWLGEAQLQGASLDKAQLQGAVLDGAQLQGASLVYARLQGASLQNICVWRADARKAVWRDTRVIAPKTGAKEESPDQHSDCDWTTASFEELKKLIAEKISKARTGESAMKWIEQRLDPTKALEGEEEMAKAWADQARSSPAPEVYERSLAEQWHKTGCAAEGAPYVLRTMLARLDPRGYSSLIFARGILNAQRGFLPFWIALAHSPENAKLATAFLDKDCAGARGLSEAEIAILKAIRDRAPPPAPALSDAEIVKPNAIGRAPPRVPKLHAPKP